MGPAHCAMHVVCVSTLCLQSEENAIEHELHVDYAKLAKKKNADKQLQDDVKKETLESDRDDTSMK